MRGIKTMREIARTSGLLVAVCLLLGVAQAAHAIVVTHGVGGVYTHNNGLSTANFSSFDRAEFMFAPEFVDTITLAGFGGGTAHDHGNGARAELEVFDGSSWITMFQSGPLFGNVPLSSLFASPVTFAGLTISGLRLDASQRVSVMYHSVAAQMTYTTSGVPAPAPATAALLGVGLALACWRGARPAPRQI